MDTLRDLRKASGKTAAEVAEYLKIPRSTCSNYEQGMRAIDIKLIILIAKFFDCSEQDIITAQINSQNGR